MTNILVVNHGLGEHCGVWSYGKRFYEAIRDSAKFEFHYRECNSVDDYMAACNEVQPAVSIINHMGVVTPWVSFDIRQYHNKTVVLQHLYDDSSIVPIMNSYGGIFDHMLVLDPSLNVSDPRIHAVGRPITRVAVAPIDLNGTVQIGSFGFAMPHKQFHLIAREVNRCFDDATFNLHMTVGDFTGDYSQGILESVEAELTKPGVNLNYTSDYKDDDEIVDMMSHNRMNALFYALPPDNSGLSSAADYMVAAQRPLLVSDCASFKHVHYGTYQYPTVSFDTIAGNWEWCQNHSFELYERQAGRLQADIENVLERII